MVNQPLCQSQNSYFGSFVKGILYKSDDGRKLNPMGSRHPKSVKYYLERCNKWVFSTPLPVKKVLSRTEPLTPGTCRRNHGRQGVSCRSTAGPRHPLAEFRHPPTPDPPRGVPEDENEDKNEDKNLTIFLQNPQIS